MKTQLQFKASINTSKEAAWEILADYGSVYKYVQGVRNSYLTSAISSGVGCIRHCDLPPMMMMKQYIVEEITEWEEGEYFAYKVLKTSAPVTDGWVKWSVTGNKTRSEIHVQLEYQPKMLIGWLMGRKLKREFSKQINSGLVDMKMLLEVKNQSQEAPDDIGTNAVTNTV